MSSTYLNRVSNVVRSSFSAARALLFEGMKVLGFRALVEQLECCDVKTLSCAAAGMRSCLAASTSHDSENAEFLVCLNLEHAATTVHSMLQLS